MPLYVLFSEYQATREKRESVFPSHVAYMDQLQTEKKIFAAGPFADNGGAMAILLASSRSEAEEIASNDPIHREGVRRYEIREWKPVRLFQWELGSEKV